MGNKRRIKTVKVVRHSFEGGVEQLLDRMKAFGEEWTAKHNILSSAIGKLEDNFKRLSMASAQEFGKLWANQQQFANSIEHIDTNVLVSAKVLKEVFGQLQQIDAIFAGMREAEVPVPEVDADAVREEADKWFQGVVAGCFKQHAEELKAAEEQAKAEVEASKAKEEAKRVEEGLRNAEAPTVAPSGGQGSDIPEGATVFGG